MTGGTSGIGAALVRESLRTGHTVFTTGGDASRLESFLASCSWLGTVHRVVAEGNGGLGADPGRRCCRSRGRGQRRVLRRAIWRTGTRACGGTWCSPTSRVPAIRAKAALLPQPSVIRGQFVLMGGTAGRKVSPGNLYTATNWAVTG